MDLLSMEDTTMTIRRLVLATALSSFVFLNGAAQEAQSPPAADPGQSDQNREAQPAPSPPEAQSEEPRTLEDIFIPSEEISADEEVTFPINI